jgi:hypothetical protein
MIDRFTMTSYLIPGYLIAILCAGGANGGSSLSAPDISSIIDSKRNGGWEGCCDSELSTNTAPVQRTSVIGKDDRELLSKNRDLVGFSDKEVDQAMHCTGRIYCPGGREGLGGMQSAGAVCLPQAPYPQVKCSADRLATAGHMFINKRTNRFISRLETCQFRSYTGHTSALVTSDLGVIDPRIDAQNPTKNIRTDRVVVRLKRPIPG